MALGMVRMDIPEDIALLLADLPVQVQRGKFERAIDRALDAAGWPRGPRGTFSCPVEYWYVILREPHVSQPRGHVGPITSEQQAKRACASWQQAGWRARVSRTPFGTPLTNPFGVV